MAGSAGGSRGAAMPARVLHARPEGKPSQPKAGGRKRGGRGRHKRDQNSALRSPEQLKPTGHPRCVDGETGPGRGRRERTWPTDVAHGRRPRTLPALDLPWTDAASSGFSGFHSGCSWPQGVGEEGWAQAKGEVAPGVTPIAKGATCPPGFPSGTKAPRLACHTSPPRRHVFPCPVGPAVATSTPGPQAGSRRGLSGQRPRPAGAWQGLPQQPLGTEAESRRLRSVRELVAGRRALVGWLCPHSGLLQRL